MASIPALDQDEDKFQINFWDLNRPLEERAAHGAAEPRFSTAGWLGANNTPAAPESLPAKASLLASRG